MTMKLRAVITIDIEARDFVDAAEHQRQIEKVLTQVTDLYPTAALVFRERRASARSASSNGAPAKPPAQPTGRLSSYVD